MIDPIQKPETLGRQWHYPICEINDITNPYDICANRMAEQIQMMHLEYTMLAKKYRQLVARNE
jgi:hypothetical protein